jgi:hypothetical protein
MYPQQRRRERRRKRISQNVAKTNSAKYAANSAGAWGEHMCVLSFFMSPQFLVTKRWNAAKISSMEVMVK